MRSTAGSVGIPALYGRKAGIPVGKGGEDVKQEIDLDRIVAMSLLERPSLSQLPQAARVARQLDHRECTAQGHPEG